MFLALKIKERTRINGLEKRDESIRSWSEWQGDLDSWWKRNIFSSVFSISISEIQCSYRQYSYCLQSETESIDLTLKI